MITFLRDDYDVRNALPKGARPICILCADYINANVNELPAPRIINVGINVFMHRKCALEFSNRIQTMLDAGESPDCGKRR